MIGKVKKWLGIEGVKLELVLPEEIAISDKLVRGQIQLQSMNPQTVTGIKVVLVERYSRGRGKEKLVDEYELGEVELPRTLEVPAGEVIELDFELPFSYVRSEIEEFGHKNFLFGGIAKAARALRNARSTFRVEAEAKVKGVALNPFDKKEISLK
jgi:hypothetical protein